LCDDVGSDKSLNILSKSDLVIMHNPFEWFSKDAGKSTFDKISKNLKSGAHLVCLPSLESQNIEFDQWAINITPKDGPWKDELKDFSLYKAV